MNFMTETKCCYIISVLSLFLLAFLLLASCAEEEPAPKLAELGADYAVLLAPAMDGVQPSGVVEGEALAALLAEVDGALGSRVTGTYAGYSQEPAQSYTLALFSYGAVAPEEAQPLAVLKSGYESQGKDCAALRLEGLEGTQVSGLGTYPASDLSGTGAPPLYRAGGLTDLLTGALDGAQKRAGWPEGSLTAATLTVEAWGEETVTQEVTDAAALTALQGALAACGAASTQGDWAPTQELLNRTPERYTFTLTFADGSTLTGEAGQAASTAASFCFDRPEYVLAGESVFAPGIAFGVPTETFAAFTACFPQ